MSPELIAAATIITIVAGAIAIAEFTWKPIRRYVFRRADPPLATREQVEEVQKTLKEIREKVVRAPPGAADVGTDELAKAAGPDTEGRLREALELQAQHKEREAIECLYEAFRKDLEPRARVELHNLIGDSFTNLSQFREAEGHYRQALNASRTAKFQEGEVAMLINIGVVYGQQGKLTAAEQLLSQALDISREEGMNSYLATAFLNLGNIRVIQRDLEGGEACYRRALEIHRETGHHAGQAHALSGLGIVYLERGDLNRSQEHFQQALVIQRDTGDRLAQASQLGNLGNVYRQQGDLKRAEEHFQHALTIDREISHRLGEAQDLGNLGLLAAQRDQREEACRLLKEAAAIYQQIGAGGPGPETVRAKLKELGCA